MPQILAFVSVFKINIHSNWFNELWNNRQPFSVSPDNLSSPPKDRHEKHLWAENFKSHCLIMTTCALCAKKNCRLCKRKHKNWWYQLLPSHQRLKFQKFTQVALTTYSSTSQKLQSSWNWVLMWSLIETVFNCVKFKFEIIIHYFKTTIPKKAMSEKRDGHDERWRKTRKCVSFSLTICPCCFGFRFLPSSCLDDTHFDTLFSHDEVHVY